MESFEYKIKEYNELLEKKPDIVKMIISGNNESSTDIKKIRLILCPQNEKELRIAKISIAMFEDIANLMKAILDDRVEKSSLMENGFMNIYIEYLKAIKEGRNINKNIFDTMSPKNAARFFFDFIVGIFGSTDEVFDYISEKTGIDIYDDEFDQLINKTNKLINSQNELKAPEEYTDEEIKRTSDMCSEFHMLCKKYIMDEKEEEPKKRNLKKTIGH